MSDQSVAVIIPCYNAARYIRKAVESVLRQTYTKMDIIAVDDGGSDETREILKDYRASITIVSHPGRVNRGQAASLNIGIRHTCADLIAFMDADDLWYPEKIERQLAAFERHGDVGLVYTNGYAIDEHDAILYPLFPDSFYENNSRGQILLDCYIRTPSSIMVKKNSSNRQVCLMNAYRYLTMRCGYG